MTTLDSSQWMYATDASFYSYSIDQSLRFEDGEANYLSITQGSPTLEKKYTISAWIKLANISATTRMIIGGYDNSTGQFPFYLRSDHKLGFYDSDGVSSYYVLYGSSLLRDPSAWYHVVLNFDSANSTAAYRVRIYINGEEETMTGYGVPSSSTLPLNRPGYANQSGTILQVGASNNSTSNPFDGYMAEVHFIDGSVLAPTEFGETVAGIWIPKDTSGLTFGNNGFRLKFQNSSALGDDTSGNGNDFTATSGWATNDQVPDSPTNIFCTYNPLDRNSSGHSYQFISQGNLNLADYVSTEAALTIGGTMAMRSGKWYFECCRIAAVNTSYWGIIREDIFVGQSSIGNTGLSAGEYGYSLDSTGYRRVNGTGTSSWGSTYAQDDVFQCAYDADTGKVWFGKNNTWQGSGDPANGTNEAATVDSPSEYGYKIWTRVVGNAFSYEQSTLNCGQDSSFAGEITAGGNTDANGIGDFKYAPPSGFLAPCTANLPNPAIDPAEDEEPADHFNTVLYSGDGSSSQSITGVGFEPAWTWIKSRGNAYAWHALIDSVRGVTKFLYSNVYNTEATSSSPFKSFNIDGFSVGSDTSTARTNVSGETYVAWNWLASTSVSGSTSGAGTSKSYSGKSNTTSGFSIIAYAGNGTSGHDVPHHLGVKPEMIITKSRNYSYDWMVYHKDIPTTYSHPAYLEWNESAAAVTSSQMFEEPTSSYMGLYSNGAINRNGGNHISYCFASKDGFSKVGSFTGNGSTDGPFVYTGFRPAWLMLKRTNSTSNWSILDSQRNTYNVVTSYIDANVSSAEATNFNWADFTSNGFKFRGTNSTWNASGSHYIFLCFAEQPFKYSNAR